MRSPYLSTLALLACTTLTAAAHADTYSLALTPTGGTTTTLMVDSGKDSEHSPATAMAWYNSTILGWSTGTRAQEVVFYNQDVFSSYYGPLDLFWEGPSGYGYYSGAQLYSVANGVGTILTGTYQLTGNQALGYGCITPATLVITDLSKQVNTAATPEPSSLILLGTGLVGAAGMTRRRFFTA